MATLDQYVQRLAGKVGLVETGTTTVERNPSLDADAARVIVASSLYDSEGEVDKFANNFAFLPATSQTARCHGTGFTTAETTLFIPPVSGTYTLTLNGYGVTSALAFSANAAAVQAAIRLISGYGSALVGGTGGTFEIDLVSDTDTDITASAGTITARGLGRVKLTRPLSAIPAAGTAFRITGFLPWVDYDGWKGWRTFVNDALAQTPFVYRVPLTATTASQTVFDLSAEVDWLKLKKQVLGLYSSGEFSWTASYTPPGSSTYTLSLRLGATIYTTSALAFGASASTVQTALTTAIADSGVLVTVTGTSPLTISIAVSRLWPITLTASAGTINSQDDTEITEPGFIGPGGIFAYRNGFPVFECDPFASTTETLFLACHRRSSTWIAPQTAWDTPGPDSGYAASTTGLVSPSDRAQPDVEQVANLAYAMVCEYLYDRTKDGEWAKKLTRVGQQALWANIFDTQTDLNPGRSRGMRGGGWQKLSGGRLGY